MKHRKKYPKNKLRNTKTQDFQNNKKQTLANTSHFSSYISSSSRSYLSYVLQFLITLSLKISPVKSTSNIRGCLGPMTCPEFSDTDYLLRINDCTQEENYDIWGDCICSKDTSTIFSIVSKKLSEYACGTLSYNMTNCLNYAFDSINIGEFHKIIFNRGSSQASHQTFESCVEDLINHEYNTYVDQENRPWIIMAYIAAGVVGSAITIGSFYALSKWCHQRQQVKRIEKKEKDTSQENVFNEKSPLFIL